LSRRGRGLPATAGGVDTHRDPLTSRCGAGNCYSLTGRNCNHFTHELVQRLLKCPAPAYINRLVRARSIPRPLIESPCLGKCMHSDSMLGHKVSFHTVARCSVARPLSTELYLRVQGEDNGIVYHMN
jgi:hypothetical protein